MEDVKISINPQGFPSQFVSDSVKDSLEFGLQIGQAIQYEWFRKDGGQSRFYNQWADFHRLRLYARGEQSIQKYKNELAKRCRQKIESVFPYTTMSNVATEQGNSLADNIRKW